MTLRRVTCSTDAACSISEASAPRRRARHARRAASAGPSWPPPRTARACSAHSCVTWPARPSPTSAQATSPPTRRATTTTAREPMTGARQARFPRRMAVPAVPEGAHAPELPQCPAAHALATMRHASAWVRGPAFGHDRGRNPRLSRAAVACALGLLRVGQCPADALDELRREMRVVQERRAHALFEEEPARVAGVDVGVGHDDDACHPRFSSGLGALRARRMLRATTAAPALLRRARSLDPEFPRQPSGRPFHGRTAAVPGCAGYGVEEPTMGWDGLEGADALGVMRRLSVGRVIRGGFSPARSYADASVTDRGGGR
jgi:hypothetical protein